MKNIRFYLAALLLGAGLGGAAYYFYNSSPLLEKQSVTTISANLQGTREIDKFYTGVYHIPVIHMQRGYLKRDVFNSGQQVVKGCCSKKYEVAVGYDNLMELLKDDALIEAVCKGDGSKIPEPQILAVNCRSTVSFGKYDSTGECYMWDRNDEERKKVIRGIMADDGIIGKINSHGKESFKKLLTAFCQ